MEAANSATTWQAGVHLRLAGQGPLEPFPSFCFRFRCPAARQAPWGYSLDPSAPCTSTQRQLLSVSPSAREVASGPVASLSARMTPSRLL